MRRLAGLADRAQVVRAVLGRARRRWRGFHSDSAHEVTRANSRRAYEKLWGTPALRAEYLDAARLAFYDDVARACADLPATSVIDVGCGGGDLLLRVARERRPERVVGIDTAKSAVAHARRLVPDGRFFAADATTVRLEETFDLVLCTEVLEHVDDPEAVLDTLGQLCAPGGSIVATVPDGAIDKFEGHVHFWSESEFEALLRPRGLRSITRLGPPEPCPTLLAIVVPHP